MSEVWNGMKANILGVRAYMQEVDRKAPQGKEDHKEKKRMSLRTNSYREVLTIRPILYSTNFFQDQEGGVSCFRRKG